MTFPYGAKLVSGRLSVEVHEDLDRNTHMYWDGSGWVCKWPDNRITEEEALAVCQSMGIRLRWVGEVGEYYTGDNR